MNKIWAAKNAIEKPILKNDVIFFKIWLWRPYYEWHHKLEANFLETFGEYQLTCMPNLVFLWFFN